MSVPIPAAHIPAEPLRGTTPIVGTSLTVGDFWGWAYTDLLDSMTRGTFAEYVVRSALSIEGSVRDNGAAFDLQYGDHGIQVKSSSAVQRWRGDASPRMSFGVKLTRPFIFEVGGYGDQTRSGDCWIFCVLRPRSRDLVVARAEMLDVASWSFWAVPTRWLPPERKSITLEALRRPFAQKVGYEDLRAAVDEAIQRNIGAMSAPILSEMSAVEWREMEALHLVPDDRLERIADLVEATSTVLQPTHPGWKSFYQSRFAGIRTARKNIRFQVRADLFESDGHDVRLGVRVPLGLSVPATWGGESIDARRDSWWSINSIDMPSAAAIAQILTMLYPRV